MVRDLISRVGFRSEGQDAFARGRRRWSPGTVFPRRGIIGVSQSGAPGIRSGLGLAVEHRRGVRNALEATGRRLGAGNGPIDGEGGSAATELAGARCLGA